MAKITGGKKRIPDAIPELIECATKLRHVTAENSVLHKELSDCKTAAESDRPLLASGLRLALANAALQAEIEVLQKDAAGRVPARKAGKGSPAQP